MAEYRFAFSYSRWALWKSCPAAYKYQNIDKVPVKPSPALEKGRRVHDEIAKYLAGAADQRPASLRLFTGIADGLRSLPREVRLVEHQMAFDAQRLPAGWFGPNARWRFVWDVAVTPSPVHVDAVDWKTGKRYDSYDDQQQLFALPAFWQNPQLETFSGHWMYLDSGETDSVTFNRDQAIELTRLWEGNAAMMEADRAFVPRPSQEACRFCDFSWRKNGPCKAGV